MIQEFSPLQRARSDEVQGKEVTALRKDIGGLQTKTQRMSVSQRSQLFRWNGKLKDVSHSCWLISKAKS